VILQPLLCSVGFHCYKLIWAHSQDPVKLETAISTAIKHVKYDMTLVNAVVVFSHSVHYTLTDSEDL